MPRSAIGDEVMRTPRHRKARINDLRTLRAIYRHLQGLETAFFPSGVHYQAISRVTRAARQCAVVWTGDEGAFTANENGTLRGHIRRGQEPFPGPFAKENMVADFVEPPMTVGAARTVLNAHPDVGCPEHKPVRAALNLLPADMTDDDLHVVWLRIAGLFEDMPLVDLQAVRSRLDAVVGQDGEAAAYWFTNGIYHHAVLCETTPTYDLSKLDGLAST